MPMIRPPRGRFGNSPTEQGEGRRFKNDCRLCLGGQPHGCLAGRDITSDIWIRGDDDDTMSSELSSGLAPHSIHPEARRGPPNETVTPCPSCAARCAAPRSGHL